MLAANGVAWFALQIPWDFGVHVCFDEHATAWLAVMYKPGLPFALVHPLVKVGTSPAFAV